MDSWLPCSIILPFFITISVSACRTVERRWAITIVVTEPSSFFIRSIDFCTSYSFFLSRAEVASSKISRRGFLIKARDKAILCFSPPESWLPPAPVYVSIPSFKAETKLHAFVFIKASWISFSVASGLPSWMFSLIVVLKRTGSCPT